MLGPAQRVRCGFGPHLVVGAAADGLNVGGADACGVIGIDDVARAECDAFKQGAVDVSTRVGEVEAEDHAPRARVAHRRHHAGEVGQHDHAIGAGGRGLGFLGERNGALLAGDVAGELVAEPVGERAAGGEARHVAVLAGEEPGRVPELALADAAVRNQDDEDGGAVHHHHPAGRQDADAHRFRGGVNGAADHGRSGGKARLCRGRCGDFAHHIGRPVKIGHLLFAADFGGEPRVPPVGVEHVERRVAAGGIVIENIAACELPRHIGR